MMNSMTGFGRAEGVDHGVALRFEISSVNRKQFDAKFSLPKELGIHEGVLRAHLAKRLTRGSIMVRAELNYLEDAPAASRIARLREAPPPRRSGLTSSRKRGSRAAKARTMSPERSGEQSSTQIASKSRKLWAAMLPRHASRNASAR